MPSMGEATLGSNRQVNEYEAEQFMTSSVEYVHVVWFFCIHHQFFSSTWERHHLLYRKTTCGKLRFERCQSISRSGNGSVCSFGAGNQTISPACRHLPCDFSSRGLQQYYKHVNRKKLSAIITHMVRLSWQVCSFWFIELSRILCGFCSVDHHEDVSLQTVQFW